MRSQLEAQALRTLRLDQLPILASVLLLPVRERALLISYAAQVAFLTLHVLHAKHPYLLRRYSRVVIASIDFATVALPQVLVILIPDIMWLLYVALFGVMVICLALAVPYA